MLVIFSHIERGILLGNIAVMFLQYRRPALVINQYGFPVEQILECEPLRVTPKSTHYFC